MVYYTRSSRRELKAISSFILLGSLMTAIGTMLTADIVKRLNITPLILAPILWSVGTLFCITPTMINPESIVKYLKITGASAIGVNFGFTVFVILYFPLGDFITQILADFFVILIVYYAIKSQQFYENKDVSKDFFEAWAKPKRVTEEEVSISKEKKICLVSKGKVSR